MSKEAMKQALEALYLAVRMEPSDSIHECPEMFQGAITSLRQAIAEAEKQEQGEPVACDNCKKLEDELEPLRIKSELWKRDAIVWKSAYDVEVGYREQEQGEPVAWIFKPNRKLLWPHEIEQKNSLELNEYVPLYFHTQPKQEQVKPVAWQWLNTAHFRKKLPKDAEKGAWNPLYTKPPKQEQGEPVAWMSEENECIFFDADKPNPMDYDFWTPLYTTPQPAQKPLTDEQIDDVIWRSHKVEPNYEGWVKDQRRIWARAIEAAHGIKENT